MDPTPANPTPDPPSWLALTAGAMALMSACANPRSDLPEAEAARIRALLAHKLLSNLAQLREHPGAPPPLRRVSAQVHDHWQVLLQTPALLLAPRLPTHAASPSLH